MHASSSHFMSTIHTTFACSSDRQLADAALSSCHEMVVWGLTNWQTGDIVISDEV